MADTGNDPAGRSDKDLTVAFQHGDDGAFDAIYSRHHDRVRATCHKLLRNASEAEEATQETFLRCYRSLGRFNGQYQLGAWMARIATNVSLDLLRARSRAIALSGVPVEEIELEHAGKAVDDTVEDTMQVTQALGGIQPLHAEALYLRAIEGLSHEEMAGRLAMSPQQVKSLLHRSRSSFRRVWDTASGWALAPLVGFRSMLTARSRDTAAAGQGLVLAGSPGSALLAEKVAASAVAFAVVLSGAPATERATPDTPRSATPRIAHELPHEPRTNIKRTSPADIDHDAPAAARPASKVAAVLDEVAKTGRKLKRQAQENQPDEPEHDDDIPSGGPSVGAANKEVRKVVREVKETIGDLP